jgi:hypothetical protein
MKENYYSAALLGVVLGISLFSFFYIVRTSMNVKPVEAIPPKPIVEVVGTYKDCEIIQYTNENLARYSYMLYCENQK